MKSAELTTEILFKSGQFRIINPADLKEKHGIDIFPCRVMFDDAHQRIVLICPRSQNGEDYGLNAGLLKVAMEAENKKKIKKAYVALVKGNDPRNSLASLELVSYITVKDQVKRVKNVKPRQGRLSGAFYWVDSHHNPSVKKDRSETQGQRDYPAGCPF